MIQQARDLLRTIYGFPAFRGLQEEVIGHLLAGGDGLVLMPTGGGKSVCFQIPALLRPGVGIVVSPLIALMQDQVGALRQLGIRASLLNSSLSAREGEEVLRQVWEGGVDLLYLAPERLMMERTLEFLQGVPLALLAIDEAHCVSQWGHDFRPDYLALSQLPERFPGVPRLALTATADQPTRREIMERLHLTQGRLFVSGFDRPNIRYHLSPKGEDTFRRLLAFIKKHHAGQAGIVYRLTRADTEATAERLREHGIESLPYHAGLDAETRRQHQARFQREEGVVVAATIAFGMGIDKPDVRFVAHLDLPKSIEAYYQETGRAGRDGLPANAWLAYGAGDVMKHRYFIDQSEADEPHKELARRKLQAMADYCRTTGCRRQALLRYFGEEHPGGCGNCDICLDPVLTWDATEAARKALSCVYRTGQRWGVEHLVEVLRGEETERVKRLGHHQVSTFGIGRELSEREWRGVFRQLQMAGLLQPNPEGGGATLTPDSRPLLRGERTFLCRREPTREEAAPQQKEKRPRKPKGGGELPSGQGRLWEALRAKRSELAKEQGLYPFQIFSDNTLRDMLDKRPASREEMAAVFGVGRYKLEAYGELFLAVIREQG